VAFECVAAFDGVVVVLFLVVVAMVVVGVLIIALVVGAVVLMALVVTGCCRGCSSLFNDRNTNNYRNKGHTTHIYHPI